MLIEDELFFDSLEHVTMQLGKYLPLIHNSIFGKIIGGKFGTTINKSVNTFLLITEEVNNSVIKLWKLQTAISTLIYKQTKKSNVKLISNNYKTNKKNRYIVDLSLKN